MKPRITRIFTDLGSKLGVLHWTLDIHFAEGEIALVFAGNWDNINRRLRRFTRICLTRINTDLHCLFSDKITGLTRYIELQTRLRLKGTTAGRFHRLTQIKSTTNAVYEIKLAGGKSVKVMYIRDE